MKKYNEYAREYIEYCTGVKRLSSRTIDIIKFVLEDFRAQTGITLVEDISNKDVNKWFINQTHRCCAGATVNTRCLYFKTFIRWCMDNEVKIPKLKLEKIEKVKEMPPRRVCYSPKEIEKALDVAKPMEWLLIKLAYDCGLRLHELTNLRLQNIKGNRIDFVGKGNKLRETYIATETRERLEQWIKAENVTDYLWAAKYHYSSTNLHLTDYTIRLTMKKAFMRAGIDDFYPHALRHSFATAICNNGAPLTVAQRMLGHSSIRTTERYIHSFDGSLEKYFNKYRFGN